MKKINSATYVMAMAIALSFPIFFTSQAIALQAIIAPRLYPYAILTPKAPTQSDSVVMKLIMGNNSNDCMSPYLSSFRVIQISNWVCVRAPCPQVYLIKIGYKPDISMPIERMCPANVGPYGPTYHFGVLSVGNYTVVDTTAGNDTLLSFVVNEKSNLISISGTVTKWNALIYDSGPAVVGAKVYLAVVGLSVYLNYPNNLAILQTNAVDARDMPVFNYQIIDSTVTDAKGAYSFAGRASGSYMMSVSAVNYQPYSTPDMALARDTILSTVLLPINAVGSVSGLVSSYASCRFVNNTPYCTGLLVPLAGCTVTVTLPPVPYTPLLAKRSAAFMPANYTTVTDNNGRFSFQSIPVSYYRQPMTVTAFKANYNKKSAAVSLISTPIATQNFSLEASYTNSNTIEKNGMRYTIATDKAVYKTTDSIFTRYTVENASSSPDTFFLTPGCAYDMNVVKPPHDTLYQYMGQRGCAAVISIIVLQPNQTLTMDFPGWRSNSAYDSLRVSAMLTWMTATVASIGIRFEKPFTEIIYNTLAMKTPFENAKITFDRLSNILNLYVASAQSVQVNLYGLDGRKIAAVFNREQCGSGNYRFPLNQYVPARGCLIAKLKTSVAESVMPITIIR